MKFGFRGIRSAMVLMSCWAVALGCVSSGRYQALLAERDQLSQQKSQLADANTELEATLDEVQSRNEQLNERLAAARDDGVQLRGTYNSLVSELKSEVASGKIQIDQLANGIRLNLAEDILFPSGSVRLDDGGKSVLGRVAGEIERGKYVIEVEGHTDDVPISSRLQSRFPSNWELAAARATEVVRLMQTEGVDGGRLRAVSKGPFAPVALNDTEEGRAQNRRIEIRLVPVTPRGNVVSVPASIPHHSEP